MTPQQIGLVKKTWLTIAPITDKTAELFYGRLFELEPDFKIIFKNDMVGQGRKLMLTLNLAVKALDDVAPLVPVLKKMGADHTAYGVKDSDYDVMGTALLWALEQVLGDAFTEEVKNAWAVAYETLANTMKAGAAA